MKKSKKDKWKNVHFVRGEKVGHLGNFEILDDKSVYTVGE